MKNCPVCKSLLTAKKLGPVEVDECRSCGGIWMEKDELRRAKDAQDPDLNWMDFEIWKHEDQFQAKNSARECPVCAKSMVSLHYGETAVEIDTCQSCEGVWLDQNEFEKIIDALETEIVTKSLSEYVKECLREGKDIIAHPDRFVSEWKEFTTVLGLMQQRLFVEKPKFLKSIVATLKRSPIR